MVSKTVMAGDGVGEDIDAHALGVAAGPYLGRQPIANVAPSNQAFVGDPESGRYPQADFRHQHLRHGGRGGKGKGRGQRGGAGRKHADGTREHGQGLLLLHREAPWRGPVERPRGEAPWRGPVERPRGEAPWRGPVERPRGEAPWRGPVERPRGEAPWRGPVERPRGEAPWRGPVERPRGEAPWRGPVERPRGEAPWRGPVERPRGEMDPSLTRPDTPVKARTAMAQEHFFVWLPSPCSSFGVSAGGGSTTPDRAILPRHRAVRRLMTGSAARRGRGCPTARPSALVSATTPGDQAMGAISTASRASCARAA